MEERRRIDLPEYISRKEALAVFGDIHPLDHNANAYVKQIKHIPAADVRPVVQGKWNAEIDHRYGVDNWRFYCSKCGFVEVHAYFDWKRHNFCPNCGADMRGKEDDDAD